MNPQVAHVQKLFIKHSRAIRGYLLALLPDVHRVDDLMHQVFLAATDLADRYDTEREFVPWARGIARIELLRQAREQQHLPMPLGPDAIDALSKTEIPALDWSEARRSALDECLKSLARRPKEAISLRYLENLRPPEIAQRMKLAVTSVHVMLSRARLALRRCVSRKLQLGEEI